MLLRAADFSPAFTARPAASGARRQPLLRGARRVGPHRLGPRRVAQLHRDARFHHIDRVRLQVAFGLERVLVARDECRGRGVPAPRSSRTTPGLRRSLRLVQEALLPEARAAIRCLPGDRDAAGTAALPRRRRDASRARTGGGDLHLGADTASIRRAAKAHGARRQTRGTGDARHLLTGQARLVRRRTCRTCRIRTRPEEP